jgi:DNA-binding response OmpR family regulator
MKNNASTDVFKHNKKWYKLSLTIDETDVTPTNSVSEQSVTSCLSSNNKKRVMVVDDEPDITFTLQAGLIDGGFDVDVFTDPELALSSFKPGLYDLVLIDIMMPKMDGFVLYERLKTVEPDVKVCFLTAGEMYREEIRQEEHGTLNKDLFLQKPISTDDLIREIKNKINSN